MCNSLTYHVWLLAGRFLRLTCTPSQNKYNKYIGYFVDTVNSVLAHLHAPNDKNGERYRRTAYIIVHCDFTFNRRRISELKTKFVLIYSRSRTARTAVL